MAKIEREKCKVCGAPVYLVKTKKGLLHLDARKPVYRLGSRNEAIRMMGYYAVHSHIELGE